MLKETHLLPEFHQLFKDLGIFFHTSEEKKCIILGWKSQFYRATCNLYYNYEKYPLSPLKPRGLALLSWHVPYNWGSGNSVHQSFLSLYWRKSTILPLPGADIFSKLTAIVTSYTHGSAASYCDVTMAHCSHGYLWTHEHLCLLSSSFSDPRVLTRGIASLSNMLNKKVKVNSLVLDCIISVENELKIML